MFQKGLITDEISQNFAKAVEVASEFDLNKVESGGALINQAIHTMR